MTATPEPASAPLSSSDFSRRSRLPGAQEFGLFVVVLLLGGGLSVYGYYDAASGQLNTFLNPANLFDGIATQMSYYAIMAVGLTFVIISGGIDISVGSIFALSGFVTAYVLQQFEPHASAWIALPVSIAVPLAVGLACGLINGLLIVGLRLHPFIVTLGTLSVFRGLTNVLPFKVKTLPANGKPMPLASITHLFHQKLFGVQAWPMIVTLIVVVFAHVYLKHMVAGRENYAVGGNEEAARFSGINVGRVKIRVYALSGLLAGLAGLVSLGRFGTMSTDSGNGYELAVVAAAVVGGASLTGGRGTAIGALLGTLILAMIDNAIDILRINQEYKQIIIGCALIAAAALDQVTARWQQRRSARG